MAEHKGFFLYLDQFKPISRLTREQKGELLEAMFAHNAGEPFEFSDPLVEMAFGFFEQTFERDRQRYEDKCAKMRDNAARKQTPADVTKSNQLHADATKSTQQQEQKQEQDKNKRQENTPYIPLEGDGEQEPNSLSLFTLASAEPGVVHGTSPSAETGKGAQRSKRKVKGADLPPYTAWFEECWKAYPRRSGKANAWRAFYELDELGEIPPDMVQRIKNRCFEPDWQRGIKNPEEERYIQHMATWLHARGWEDEGCESVTDSRNTPEDNLRNEIMGKYNFGMPMPGDTLEQATKRSVEMNLELDAAGL